MFPKGKLSLAKWIAILPKIAELVGYVVDSFKDDGKIDAAELQNIGERLVAIVAAVAAPGL